MKKQKQFKPKYNNEPIDMKLRKIVIPALMVAAAATAGPLYRNSKAPIDARVEDLLSRMTLEEKVNQMRNIPVGKARRDTRPLRRKQLRHHSRDG